MTRINLILTIISLILFQNVYGKTVYVKTHLPKEETGLTPSILIEFSSEINKQGMNWDYDFIEVTPKINCLWSWPTNSTLKCKVKEVLDYSQTYKIEINKKKVGQNLIAPHSFEIKTKRFKVNLSMGNWVSAIKPRFKIYSEAPISYERVLNSILLAELNNKNIKSNVILDIDCMKDQYKKSNLRQNYKEMKLKTWCFQPEKDLIKDKSYSIIIKKSIHNKKHTESDTYKIEDYKIFKTFKDFSIIGIDCSEGSLFEKKEKENSNFVLEKIRICSPNSQIEIKANSPIPTINLKVLNFNPQLNGGDKDYDPWYYYNDNSYDSKFSNRNLTYENESLDVYRTSIPGLLIAGKKYKITGLVKDVFGRSQEIDLEFIVGDKQPEARNPYNKNVIIEKNNFIDYPLFTQNIDEFEVKGVLKGLDFSKEISKKYQSKRLNKYTITPINSKEMLGDKSGYFSGKIYYKEKDQKKALSTDISFQRTNLNIVAKYDKNSVLVFVSYLNKNEVVENALVELQSYDEKLNQYISVASAETSKDGTVIIPENVEEKKIERVFVKTKDDFAFIDLNWDNNYSYGYISDWNDYETWGITPQGLYKAGDKVDFKIWVRERIQNKLKRPTSDKISIEIEDPRNKTVFFNNNLKLSEFGTIDGSFQTKKDFISGEYYVKLKINNKSHTPMTFLISEFKPTTYFVSLEHNSSIKDKYSINLNAKMYSGGSFTGAESRLKMRYEPKGFYPISSKHKEYRFGRDNSSEHSFFEESISLNDKGFTIYETSKDSIKGSFGDIVIEGSVKDIDGKYISEFKKIKHTKYSSYVGIKRDKWSYEIKDNIKVNSIVLDNNEKEIQKGQISYKLYKEEIKKTKLKTSGNVFKSKNDYEWVEKDQCNNKISDENAICNFQPNTPGYYKITATMDNTTLPSEIYFYVSGSSWITWDETDDSLTIKTSKESYKKGETLNAIIENPYKEAIGLITIESNGIIDKFVKKIKKSVYKLEIPIKKEYMPGFKLSVLLTSPRVEGTEKGYGKLDLGKPTFKHGSVVINIIDSYKEIDLKLSTNKESYKPLDEVELTIEPSSNTNKEAAIVVVDKSVLDLIPNSSKKYDITKGFSEVITDGVKSYAILKAIIGRINFEKKGANQGGDGGNAENNKNTRGKTNYVAYWNPNIVLRDKQKIKFKLPKNKTTWKVIVISNDDTDSFGIAETNFIASKKLETNIYAPTFAYEGDRIKILANFRNKTGSTTITNMSLEHGDKKASKSKETNDSEMLTLELPIEIKNESIELYSSISDKNNSDEEFAQIKLNNKYEKSYDTRLYDLSKKKKIEINLVKNARPQTSKVKFTYLPSIVGKSHHIFRSMRDYDYWCWEQKLSRAVTASFYNEFENMIPEYSKWSDTDKFIKQIIEDIPNHQGYKGGFSFYSQAKTSNYLSAYTLYSFSILKENGYEINDEYINNLISYNKSLLKELDKNVDYLGLLLMGLYKFNELNKNDFQRYYSFIQSADLFNKTLFVDLSKNLMDDDTLLIKLLNDISKFMEIDEYTLKLKEDSFWYMSTSLRTNCSFLSSIINLENENSVLTKDASTKLATYILNNLDQYLNPQEAAYCIRALSKFHKNKEIDNEIPLEISINNSNYKILPYKHEVLNAQEATNIITEQNKGYIDIEIQYVDNKYGKENINKGFEIIREISLIKDNIVTSIDNKDIKPGDMIKVDLLVSNYNDDNFVVVSDYFAAGLKPVNELLTGAVYINNDIKQQLATDSKIANYEDRYKMSTYKDIRQDRVDFYIDNMRKGNYHFTYFLQATNKGSYYVKPTKVIKMYNKNNFGYNREEKLEIK